MPNLLAQYADMSEQQHLHFLKLEGMDLTLLFYETKQ
jgi:hypothetical protein